MKAAQVFYILICPTTEAEEKGLVCGSLDLGLSALGLIEAKKSAVRLAKALKKRDEQVASIFCSPLLRSIQAADFVHDELHLKKATPLRVFSDLRERKLGSWEGQLKSRLPGYDPLAEVIAGGELLDAFQKRVEGVLAKLGDDSKSVVLILHEVFARMLLSLMAASSHDPHPGQIFEAKRASERAWDLTLLP